MVAASLGMRERYSAHLPVIVIVTVIVVVIVIVIVIVIGIGIGIVMKVRLRSEGAGETGHPRIGEEEGEASAGVRLLLTSQSRTGRWS